MKQPAFTTPFFSMDDNVYKLSLVLIGAFSLFLIIGIVRRSRVWADLTQDGKGRYVPLRFFRTLFLTFGTLDLIAVALLDLCLHQDHSTTVGIFFLTFGAGLQWQKSREDQVNRLTKDEAGNPLATPPENTPPLGNPPELMPQAPSDPVVVSPAVNQAATQFFAPVPPTPAKPAASRKRATAVSDAPKQV